MLCKRRHSPFLPQQVTMELIAMQVLAWQWWRCPSTGLGSCCKRSNEQASHGVSMPLARKETTNRALLSRGRAGAGARWHSLVPLPSQWTCSPAALQRSLRARGALGIESNDMLFCRDHT